MNENLDKIKYTLTKILSKDLLNGDENKNKDLLLKEIASLAITVKSKAPISYIRYAEPIDEILDMYFFHNILEAKEIYQNTLIQLENGGFLGDDFHKDLLGIKSLVNKKCISEQIKKLSIINSFFKEIDKNNLEEEYYNFIDFLFKVEYKSDFKELLNKSKLIFSDALNNLEKEYYNTEDFDGVSEIKHMFKLLKNDELNYILENSPPLEDLFENFIFKPFVSTNVNHIMYGKNMINNNYELNKIFEIYHEKDIEEQKVLLEEIYVNHKKSIESFKNYVQYTKDYENISLNVKEIEIFLLEEKFRIANETKQKDKLNRRKI